MTKMSNVMSTEYYDELFNEDHSLYIYICYGILGKTMELLYNDDDIMNYKIFVMTYLNINKKIKNIFIKTFNEHGLKLLEFIELDNPYGAKKIYDIILKYIVDANYNKN